MSDLIVCALEAEAGGLLSERNVVFTGVGKVNAAYYLMRAIAKQRPSRVVNIGTAGSTIFKAGSVVNCISFIQRDMNVLALTHEQYKTPFSDDPVKLVYGETVPGYPTACCGTGDSFEMDLRHDQPWQVVEMEAHTLALICQREGIPFICLKYISDGADGTAAEDWPAALADAARKLAAAMEKLPGI